MRDWAELTFAGWARNYEPMGYGGRDDDGPAVRREEVHRAAVDRCLAARKGAAWSAVRAQLRAFWEGQVEDLRNDLRRWPETLPLGIWDDFLEDLRRTLAETGTFTSTPVLK